MHIEIGPGESITIKLRGADGEFVVAYTDSELTVTSELPDSDGREGIIYSERFGLKRAGRSVVVDDEDELEESDRDYYKQVLIGEFVKLSNTECSGESIPLLASLIHCLNEVNTEGVKVNFANELYSALSYHYQLNVNHLGPDTSIDVDTVVKQLAETSAERVLSCLTY